MSRALTIEKNPLKNLARFAATTSIASLPSGVIDKARAVLLYGLGIGVASVGERGLVRIVKAVRREYGGDGHSTCLVDGSRLPPGAAAFANGALFHVRIQDDAHPSGHMGVVILPAVLAVAEALGKTGRQLLEAIVSGYEVSLRIGRDHAVDLSERGFRTTPIYGAMGAAAGCARLLDMDTLRTSNALALTTHAIAGLRQFADVGTDEYPYQAGFAARNGLTSALLAYEGIEGTDTALTGRAGLYRAYGRPEKDYGARLLDGLGSSFEIEKVTYKPYPGGQFHRGVIRGFSVLRQGADPDAVAAADVHMHPFEANYLGLGYKGPFRTYSQAFFSVPFCAALAWRYGNVTFETLHKFDDPTVLSFVQRTNVVSDPSCDRYRPVIQLTLKDGTTVQWRDDVGEEGYDLTWDAAVSMMRQLCAESSCSASTFDELIRAVHEIGTADSVETLLRAAKSATVVFKSSTSA